MGKFIRDIIITVVAALAIFLILQVTVGSFKVHGMSMMPSVQHGDYIMVSKAAYFFHEPDRGDVIVFHSPRSPGSDLIKRIIGLPGDTVEVKNGKVFVNGTPLMEPYIMEQPKYEYPLQKVQEGNYFVLGDNRNNSADSHTGWVLPRENIIGKAWFSYWPPVDWMAIKHYPILSQE